MAVRACHPRRIVGDGLPPVSQRFGEAERVEHHRPRAAAQRRSDLTRKQRGRGTGHHDFGATPVQEAPHEALPARHGLDLVEAPEHRARAVRVGHAAAVLLQQKSELRAIQPRQEFVLEVHVRHERLLSAGCQPIAFTTHSEIVGDIVSTLPPAECFVNTE